MDIQRNVGRLDHFFCDRLCGHPYRYSGHSNPAASQITSKITTTNPGLLTIIL